tara:strand:- start:193 stop:405 length:213 start_codon:yes stop_codon:yes gene_type:complete
MTKDKFEHGMVICKSSECMSFSKNKPSGMSFFVNKTLEMLINAHEEYTSIIDTGGRYKKLVEKLNGRPNL